MQWLWDALGRLPPLKKKKNPALAGALGFFTGGIALAIYFRSLLDLVIPFLLAILAAVLFTTINKSGWVGGALVAGGYGIARCLVSNKAIEDAEKELNRNPDPVGSWSQGT
jgi:hypothetical protein